MMFKAIKEFLKNRSEGKKVLAPEGVCPNCWGKQAYADEFVTFTEDQTKANVNHDKEHQKAFIQQFMETNVTGIQLKRDGSELTCSRCKVKYKR